MSTRKVIDAHTYRKMLLRVIWIGARRISADFDPRIFAPERLSGEPGETFSQCTLEELRGVAFKLKQQVPSLWVPAPPKGLYLRQATPAQLGSITEHLGRQEYLIDPDAFFRNRLGVRDPQNPSFAEAKKMLSYLTTKERRLSCAGPA